MFFSYKYNITNKKTNERYLNVQVTFIGGVGFGFKFLILDLDSHALVRFISFISTRGPRRSWFYFTSFHKTYFAFFESKSGSEAI